jgi:phosphatidylglycerophosphatase A
MARLIASLFGVGLILGKVRGSDAGAGTVGSLVALPLVLVIGEAWGWPGQLVGAVLVTALSFWSSNEVAAAEGDAGWIVIDEAAGTFISTIGLLGWPAVIAFGLFRLVDITKRPFPGVQRADSMKGAAGVTLDDVVAGLWALGLAHLINATLF